MQCSLKSEKLSLELIACRRHIDSLYRSRSKTVMPVKAGSTLRTVKFGRCKR